MDELEARTSALRDQVGDMLASVDQQTRSLRDAQAHAAAVTGQASSPDGQVSVTVDAAGVVTNLRFAPSAFARNTPDKLSPVLVHTIQAAAMDARRKVDAALAPAREGIPDLPDLLADAPGLRDLVSKVPPPPMPASDPGPVPPQKRPRPRLPPRSEEFDEEPMGPILRRDYQ